MEIVEVSCYLKKDDNTENGFILFPKTNLDKAAIYSFLDDRGRYCVLRLTNRAKQKTYDQTKAFWALASLYYQVYNGKAPTSNELQYWYEDLLKPTLFPVRQNSVSENKFVPKSWSELTVSEGIDVISKMLILVSEAEGLPQDADLTCKDIFEWVQEQKKTQHIETQNNLEDKVKKLSLAQEVLQNTSTDETQEDIF